MAKIADLTVLTSIADGDLVPVVDVSDTTDSDDGSTKYITKANLVSSATPTELNVLDGVTAGTVTASKALVVGANKELDEVHAEALYIGAGAGTQVTATAAEINSALDGITATYTELNQLASNTVGGTSSGDIVTIDDTQTLSNKTLTTPSVDVISEETADTGVTVDGVLLKDSNVDLGITGTIKGQLYTINDDSYTSFTPAETIGMMFITGRHVDYDDISGICTFRTAATAATYAIASGSSFAVTAGALNGTTGTDGKLTVSANSADGKIYIENRRGEDVSISVNIIGN